MGKSFWLTLDWFRSNQGKNKDKDEKFTENKYDIWTLHPKSTLHANFHESLRKKVLDAFFTDFWLIEAKKGKILGNKYDFWTLQPNIRWYTNFHENLEAKNFDWFLTDSWLIETKIKMKMKKLEKMCAVFELPTLKLSCLLIFMKIWE